MKVEFGLFPTPTRQGHIPTAMATMVGDEGGMPAPGASAGTSQNLPSNGSPFASNTQTVNPENTTSTVLDCTWNIA